MCISRFSGIFALVVAGGILAAANAVHAPAQVVIAPTTPVIGSSNTVSADARIPRLQSYHCTVNLFSNLEFADFNNKTFTYTPPAGCPGPWSKVIFAADFTVTAGRQYDRTAEFYLGGANIFYGTTAEPRSALSPAWHVENDITDLSALLTTPQAGSALLGNYVGVYDGVNYNGIIYSSAHLVFYPATAANPGAVAPDVVIGLPGNSGAVSLNNTASQLVQSVTLPTNVESAYLDVISQSQSNDEFWYLCVPNDLTTPLQSCGSTGFRETEISIDGVPAGVAPVYPWIYTGGIDPYLWEPIPGVQTLNFKPFRVDLTPFAGVLSNGKPHTVAISVFNADSYFLTTGNLLIYTDKGTKQVTGSVLSNSLAASPTPTVANNIVTDSSGNITGSVTVASNRTFTIVGSANTSHGLVTTQVTGIVDFTNTQNFVINEVAYKQDLVQSTEGSEVTTTTANGLKTVTGQTIHYPFTFNYDEVVNSDGSLSVNNISNQTYDVVMTGLNAPVQVGEKPYVVGVEDVVSSEDELFYDANGNFTGHTGSSSQHYETRDSNGYCYNHAVAAINLKLSSAISFADCKPLNAFQ